MHAAQAKTTAPAKIRCWQIPIKGAIRPANALGSSRRAVRRISSGASVFPNGKNDLNTSELVCGARPQNRLGGLS
jgi:hypothetical protein